MSEFTKSMTTAIGSASAWGGVREAVRAESNNVAEAVNRAVDAASQAQGAWGDLGIKARTSIIAAVRTALSAHVPALARMAVRETGLGRVEDKIAKNRLVIEKTPGPEFLQADAYTGDDGHCIVEYAPYGVIGAITPVTNPSETIICNAIAMLSAGNAIVFNAHPSAARVSAATVEIIEDAIVNQGGPVGCVSAVSDPSIESAAVLMKHPGISLLVVTGGAAVVRAAMMSGKRVIAAGPGNPPVVVDETADIPSAAECIVRGASLDNNIVCIAEKEILAIDVIADDLLAQLKAKGTYVLDAQEVDAIEGVVLEHDGSHKRPNKAFVGKDIALILRSVGIDVPPPTRMAVCEVQADHPFVTTEMLMPIVPLVRVADFEAALALAVSVEQGNRHTAVIHSKDLNRIRRMERAMGASIFVSNAPSYAGLSLGGEGYTSFTIASPTGEGLTTCRDFARERRWINKVN
jgi:acyl-CoA reductase-like NAD-dependent aldehyde dehydrogenase